MFSDSALPILNGVSVSIDALIGELRELGHSVHLFTAAYPNFRDPDPNTYRFPAAETPWTKGYPLALPPFYTMLRHFRRHKFDVIHAQTPFTLGFVGLRWAQSHGIPIVGSYHTLYDKYVHYIPFFPKRYVRFKVAKHTNFFYNSVDRVITPSDSAHKWLLRHSVRKPIDVIPTGVASARMLDRSEVRMRLGITPESRVLLYVGRIAKEKNMRLLFEAAALAFRRDPHLRFWLVGDGPYRPECVEHARALGIGDRVKFVGDVPRADVDQYYAAADLFVFGSTTETQGLVVSEAMAYGLPAVVTYGGGAGASVRHGENGLMVKSDPLALAAAVVDLLGDDASYAAMSQAAGRSAQAYSSVDMARRVLNVYDQVMKVPVAPQSAWLA